MDNPLAEPSAPLSLVSSTRVPNVFPEISVPYRLAIIGEAPGAEEEAHLLPFVGASGKFLDSILNSVGILRAGCFVGNVCKFRPPGNDIAEFGYDHPKVLEGVTELRAELQEFKPNCCLLLGNTPLHFAANLTGVSSWNASILSTSFGKAVAAFHPAAVLREYKNWPLLRHACARARTEAESPELNLPKRSLELNLSANEICHRLDNWPTGQLFSFDIEGGLDAFPCCSVAGESNRGFIIAWSNFSEGDQARIAVSLSRALYSSAIPKVLQNSLYDRFILAYGYRMLIRNVVDDTMDKQWSIYPELPKNLGTIGSIWTREPYYKFERKTDNPEVFYQYCIKDSCVTLEASLAMENCSLFTTKEKKHYQTMLVGLKNPLLYMQLRGMNYDVEQVRIEAGQVRAAMLECATRLELRIQPMQFTKKEFSNRIRGAKGAISSTRLVKVLYEQKGYPKQYKGRGMDKKLTSDVEAILNLAKPKTIGATQDTFLADILLHRKLEGILETLEWQPDVDGRMKCGYNQFSKGEDNMEEGGGATDTGRLRCSKSNIPAGDDFVGGNLQTVTKKLRRLYRADPGFFLFQCDLAGADGWTVAAWCLHFNDPTMWDDYKFGIKPARVVALMFQHGVDATKCSREELKERCKTIDDDGWLYFACKRVQHATNYGVQGKTMSTQIMKDGYKVAGTPIYVDVKTCEALQRLYYVRYPGVYTWQNHCKRQVAEGQNLTSASGHTRTFFGRRKSWDHKTRSFSADHETWKEFLADEPQENTTYATNRALYNLWHDPENRNGRSLVIEPLHQVHDALIGQFPKERAEWAVGKIRAYFQNELIIANTKVVIPFDGAYGPSWGELGEKYGGGKI